MERIHTKNGLELSILEVGTNLDVMIRNPITNFVSFITTIPNYVAEFMDTMDQDEYDFAQLVEKDVYDYDGNQIGHYNEATYFDNSFIQD